MITYDCEGCGVEVNAFYTAQVPTHHFCLTCELLNQTLRHDLKEFQEVYDRIRVFAKERPS